jgi:hypothetical protein
MPSAFSYRPRPLAGGWTEYLRLRMYDHLTHRSARSSEPFRALRFALPLLLRCSIPG